MRLKLTYLTFGPKGREEAFVSIYVADFKDPIIAALKRTLEIGGIEILRAEFLD